MDKKNYWIRLSLHLRNYGDLGGCYPPLFFPRRFCRPDWPPLGLRQSILLSLVHVVIPKIKNRGWKIVLVQDGKVEIQICTKKEDNSIHKKRKFTFRIREVCWSCQLDKLWDIESRFQLMIKVRYCNLKTFLTCNQMSKTRGFDFLVLSILLVCLPWFTCVKSVSLNFMLCIFWKC